MIENPGPSKERIEQVRAFREDVTRRFEPLQQHAIGRRLAVLLTGTDNLRALRKADRRLIGREVAKYVQIFGGELFDFTNYLESGELNKALAELQASNNHD